MIIPALAFYMFAATLLFSAVMVVSAKNPVHSVLFLIFAFFNAAGLFILRDAEFVAMMLVVVYVGAVAVLFLFVVMMLDMSFNTVRDGARKVLPIGIFIGLALLAELLVLISTGTVDTTVAAGNVAHSMTPENAEVGSVTSTNVYVIGNYLYTEYALLFQGAGLVLLVAMVGAIVLTLRQRDGVRKQAPSDQVNRKREDVVTIQKVENGGGVS